MAFLFTYLKSAFTSLAGANVDVDVLRSTIVNGGIIVQVMLPQPEGIRWIDDVADPTLQFSFVTDLSGAEETELDSIVAAHAGPFAVSDVVRVYAKTGEPGVTDDSDSGFKSGDEWNDSVTGHTYVAGDMTPGAAVWNWQSGWGKVRPDELAKLRADFQTDDESDPATSKILVTDGSGDFDLKAWGSTQDGGYFENFGAITTASNSTPVARIDESPTLLAGRYLIEWKSETAGSTGATMAEGRFSFDGGLIDSYTAIGRNKFDGSIERVVAAGTRAMLLEIAKTSGGGQAEMGKSTIRYSWIAVT